MSVLTQSSEWQALSAHAHAMQKVHVRELCAQDATRFTSYSRCEVDLLLDFSRQRLNNETLQLLFKLADARGLRARMQAMFDGERINTTENRAVLHTALRAKGDRKVVVDGHDVMPEVRENLARMREFVDGVHGGASSSYRKTFTDIVKYRHRRLRSRHRDGDRSIGALPASQFANALRLEHRWRAVS